MRSYSSRGSLKVRRAAVVDLISTLIEYEQNSASSINSIKNKVLVTLILIKLKESTIV